MRKFFVDDWGLVHLNECVVLMLYFNPIETLHADMCCICCNATYLTLSYDLVKRYESYVILSG